MHTGFSTEEIKHYVVEHKLLDDSGLFGEEELKMLYDLDEQDWINIEKRHLFSPYIFENYHKLLTSPQQRVDTIYVLSKLEENYWQNIFDRSLYLLIGLKIFCASDMMLLSKLTDSEFERADKLGVFDYDNELMQEINCQELYLLAKYPQPLLEEAIKRGIYKSPAKYKKLLKDEKLFPSEKDNKQAFELQNCDSSKLNKYPDQIKQKVKYLKSTQIYLPQTNLKKQGFCVEKIQSAYNTTNATFFAHGIKDEIALQNFLNIDKNSVIKASYIDINKRNARLLYNQGLILNVKSNSIHAGYYKDMQTFELLDIDSMLSKYVFNGNNNEYRTYFSALFKKVFDFDDEMYIKFLEEYKDKVPSEIKDDKIKSKIVKYLESIPVKYYEREHNHNEILITNPTITAIFVYDTVNFDIPKYLTDFAKERNLTIYMLS